MFYIQFIELHEFDIHNTDFKKLLPVYFLLKFVQLPFSLKTPLIVVFQDN